MTIAALLLLIAVILFLLAAFGVGGSVNLTALGLACFAGSFLVGGLALS